MCPNPWKLGTLPYMAERVVFAICRGGYVRHPEVRGAGFPPLSSGPKCNHVYLCEKEAERI